MSKRPMPGGMPKGGSLKENFGAIKRALGKLFEYYPRLAPLTILCILFTAIVSSIPALFVQNILYRFVALLGVALKFAVDE